LTFRRGSGVLSSGRNTPSTGPNILRPGPDFLCRGSRFLRMGGKTGHSPAKIAGQEGGTRTRVTLRCIPQADAWSAFGLLAYAPAAHGGYRGPSCLRPSLRHFVPEPLDFCSSRMPLGIVPSIAAHRSAPRRLPSISQMGNSTNWVRKNARENVKQSENSGSQESESGSARIVNEVHKKPWLPRIPRRGPDVRKGVLPSFSRLPSCRRRCLAQLMRNNGLESTKVGADPRTAENASAIDSRQVRSRKRSEATDELKHFYQF
jgi:hypothetical protein